MIAVVEIHPDVAGVAAALASWSPGPRGFWGGNRGTMVRRGLGWWASARWLGLLRLEHVLDTFQVGHRSVQKNRPSMCVGVWFDFFQRPKGGSDDRGLAFVVLCTVAPRLTSVVRMPLSLFRVERY